MRDVTEPMETAISGMAGLETVQSSTFEGNSLILATFVFGTDMAAAEADVATAVANIDFPAGVGRPTVGRFNPSELPIMQFSVIADREQAEIAKLVQADVLPVISDVPGILQIQVTGEVERRVHVAVNPQRMSANGVSLFQVSAALSENNLSIPAGLIFEGGQAVPGQDHPHPCLRGGDGET